MSALTLEWVAKSESDFHLAVIAAQTAEPPEPEGICFHAQQCVEKYAKAFLVERGVGFERSHSMPYLQTLCASVDSEFDRFKTDFEALDDYSVDIRYPGESATEEEARAALDIATRLRAFFRLKLGLDQPSTPEGA